MILTEQEDGLVEVIELDEGREGQDHDNPDVDQVLRGVFVVEIWKERKKNEPLSFLPKKIFHLFLPNQT